ncbi:MAG: nicotinamide-nucleotide amidohydrolase family protein, partial [Bacteroidota bacterium]
EALPETIKLAYLPGMGRVRLRLTATGADEQQLNRQLDQAVADLNEVIPELIYGYGTEALEEVMGRILKEQGRMLATAESCTGGYIAHLITSVPGSSAYFKGSVIAYANEVKMEQLGVQEETLKAHGAVSEPTVREMVKGVIKKLGADVGIATSGIAGPGGGTADKPVGTIWMAVGDREQVVCEKLKLGKDRIRNIQFTSTQVLNLLRKFLLER